MTTLLVTGIELLEWMQKAGQAWDNLSKTERYGQRRESFVADIVASAVNDRAAAPKTEGRTI